MKTSELRGKDADALTKELQDLLKAQFSLVVVDISWYWANSLRMQRATQQLTNTSQLRKVRRDIARVRTIMGEKARAK